ncbi:putative ABC transport system permease protein [Aquimarina sp. MAR_2010_214]|uniref:ABC transporter permease n=1 Tax=Aquimarina sp. MAR_2010_214 TaxID=1250026 RepID=UPI000C713D98|nr:ABC transporter permease [Aquimarina sp. MAR_2010_214]PKV49019.1 putative ABC transport system permease protein [Aquimarina sp. MAR_2010_214]
MHTLYFKIAIRYLLKNKLYSFINILGLAIGVASFILIMVYVNYERSYDTFEGSENVYRVYMDALEGDVFEASDAQTANLIGPTLKQEFPEVIEQVRLYRFDKVTFKYDGKIIEESKGAMADETYFEVFNYPLLKGDKQNVLKEPNTIVLTESFAKKIFGAQNPIKKTLLGFHVGEEVLLTVTGVLKDIPENTHMKTNFLISLDTYATWFASDAEKKLNWGHCNFYTYLKIDKNTDKDLLKSKVIASDFEDDADERYNIEPLEDVHLYSNKPYEAETNGSISRIKFLTTIAFIVLLLSWLNYINLSTTKSLERAKEVGVRKVAGAQRIQLILQSLTESIVLNGIAIAIAIILALSMLSIYNNVTGKELVIQNSTIIELLPIISFIVIGMILTGLYPAILLSGYSPSKALKGKIRASASGLNIRKGLIVMQFLATIVLLIGTIVITKQIDFMQKQPIGAELNQTISFHGEFLSNISDSLARNKCKILETELQKFPFVESTSRTQTYPGDGYHNLSGFIGLKYPNGTEDSKKVFYKYAADSNYLDVLDIQFLAGNNFINNPKGNSNTVIINEACMREIEVFNPNEAINKTINFFGRDWVISGVIENYHHFGLKKEIHPMIILHGNSSDNLLVKFDETVASVSGYNKAITQIEEKWKQILPQRTFGYTFLDKKFEAQYNDDKEFSAAFRIFTLLAIFIAALGLFGLTSYTCVQRKKEIGIRKVNGASIFKILKLLNIDFIKWVGIAFIIAIPIAWYTMNSWLENFAIKTSLSWWIFVLAGIMALGITLITVSWQSFMAANRNPVDVLRDE